jgi:hypothetical protein
VPDELEAVLRLVAEGRLTPDEAAPIIDALSRAERADDADEDEDDWDAPDEWAGLDERARRRLERGVERAARRIDRAHERAAERAERIAARASARAARFTARASARADRGGEPPRPSSHLRIRVTERGRQVVNLRIPIGFVDSALRFVPGLGGDQADRIRTAVRAGAIGPILDVEDPDGEGGVLISVE